MQRILRLLLSCWMTAVFFVACTPSATNKNSGPQSSLDAEPKGVTLVLVPTHTSDECCRVFSVNPGRDVTVFCTIVALDPAGRLVYSGFIPAPPRGRRRSSGFDAPPGRHGHGAYQLPIDPAHDSYTAPCRPAAWHGGAPI
jgi:hypothetical protein